MNTEELKAKLLEEKELLEKELGTVAVPNAHAQGGFTAKEDDFANEPSSLDPVEVGSELESLARNEAISNELENRLANVNKALEAMAEGVYGVCTDCKEEIASDRLEANPAATTCKVHMEFSTKLYMDGKID